MKKKSSSMIVLALILISVLSTNKLTILALLNAPQEVAEIQVLATQGLNFDLQWIREFAYVEDNITRLVIGVGRTKPNSYGGLKDFAVSNGGKIVNELSIQNTVMALVVEIPLRIALSFAKRMMIEGLASYVEPNMRIELLSIPNDDYWAKQWAPTTIKADWAWNFTTGNSDILVAVIDDGINYSHPDLAPNYNASGRDWVDDDDDPKANVSSHGTHISGVIAAVINNSIGVAGLAQAQIMAERVLGGRVESFEDVVFDAIIHAVDQGARIISMSWATPGYSELIYDAIQYAYNRSTLLVAAAGNTWARRSTLQPTTRS